MPSSFLQKARSGLAVVMAACTLVSLPQAVRAQDRSRLLELGKQAYQRGLTTTPASVQNWENTFKPDSEFGYTPPGAPSYMARLAGMLYEETGEDRA